jgi:predicted dehydrogenase
MKPIEVGVVGIGGWGKNLARNYAQMAEANLRYVCDLDKGKLSSAGKHYPTARSTSRYEDLLEDPELQAVVIATNGPSHYPLAEKALRAGKDVYVEKPFTLDLEHAQELIALAEERQRILMVGHLLEYHPVVVRLRDMIRNGELGQVYYVYAQRLNLGTVRADENALWNFAPHDISVILYMLGQEPTDVSARGQCYLQRDIEDVVFLSLNFANKSMAHIQVSWLDPHKTRKITVVGSRRMAVFDDLEASEKLRIYDKGAQINTDYDTFAEFVGLRFGDIQMPYIKMTEPLLLECRHFLECVRTRRKPVSDGHDGLRVVKVLGAAQRSLKANGTPVSIA